MEITAVFTTANARVRLFKMLDWLDPSQVLYCDTDSVMMLYDKTNPIHKNPFDNKTLPDGLEVGCALGQWEDEIKGKDHIIELVIGGAKSYAYKTHNGKEVVKQKGITLDRGNDRLINFETMRDMVLNTKILTSNPRFQFRWDNKTKDVITKHIARSVKSTVKEKRNIDAYDTYPFGYN